MTLIQGDCLEVMREMDANSVDAIITDPPYYKVKGEAWDNQWDTPAKFLEWVGLLCEQFERILKPNGSLYFFASPQMAARVECEIGKRFAVLNSITWRKGAAGKSAVGWSQKTEKEALRMWLPESERIIFAEHYGADNMAKGEAGYEAKCDELRGFVFEPLRSYLAEEVKRAGWTPAGLNEAMGFAPRGMAETRYFGRSQWQLPTEPHYAKMRELLGVEYLRREYEDLRREYEDLRREYEDLRRPFAVSADVPYTDVWTFPTVAHYPGKHPCEKPIAMIEHIIRASSRPGDVVADFFLGSGTTAVACLNTGRRFVGCDNSAHWVEYAERRIAEAQMQPALMKAAE